MKALFRAPSLLAPQTLGAVSSVNALGMQPTLAMVGLLVQSVWHMITQQKPAKLHSSPAATSMAQTLHTHGLGEISGRKENHQCQNNRKYLLLKGAKEVCLIPSGRYTSAAREGVKRPPHRAPCVFKVTVLETPIPHTRTVINHGSEF